MLIVLQSLAHELTRFYLDVMSSLCRRADIGMPASPAQIRRHAAEFQPRLQRRKHAQHGHAAAAHMPIDGQRGFTLPNEATYYFTHFNILMKAYYILNR